MPHVENTATTVCGQPASSAAINWCADCFLTTLKMVAKLGIEPDNLSVLDRLTPSSNPYLGALIDALDLSAAIQHEQEQEPGHNDDGNTSDSHLCLLVRAFVESVVKYAEAVELYTVDNMGIRRWPGDIAHPERLTTNREVVAWLTERRLPAEMPPMIYWSLLPLKSHSQSLLQRLQNQTRRGMGAEEPSSSSLLHTLLATLVPPRPQAPVNPRQENPFLTSSHSPIAEEEAKAKANNTTGENVVISSSSSSLPTLVATLVPPQPQAPVNPRQENPFLTSSHSPIAEEEAKAKANNTTGENVVISSSSSSLPTLVATLVPPQPQAPVNPRQKNPFLTSSHSPMAGEEAKAKANNTTGENVVISSSSPSSQRGIFRRLPSLVTPTRWLRVSDPLTLTTPPAVATTSSMRLPALAPSVISPAPPNTTPNSSCPPLSTGPSLLFARTHRRSSPGYHPYSRPNLVPSAYAPAALHSPSFRSSSSPLPLQGVKRKQQEQEQQQQQQPTTSREREPYFQSPSSSSLSPPDFSFVAFGEASERYFANPTPENQAEYDRLNDLLNGEVRRRMKEQERETRREG